MPSVIDPRLFDELQFYYFGHQWAVYSRSVTTNALGEQAEQWTTLVSNSDRCYLARYKGVQSEADEHRTADIEAFQAPMWSCMLDGFHPEITSEMQLNVDGIDYRIRGVVHLGIDALTKLVLERIT